MRILEVLELTKHFGGLAALEDVNFEANAGEILGLIGPNGAGKTTLFNVVSGVYQPTRGKVIFQGQDITGLGFSRIAKRGLLRTYQQTNLFIEMTAFQNVAVAHHLRCRAGLWGSVFHSGQARNDRQETERSSMRILEFLGLIPWKDERAKNLPHGKQRILGIGIAMAAYPKVLLLDEPVTGMNPTEMNEMMETIGQIRDRGITIVIVEHNMRVVMGVCDRIVVLNFGRKIAEGLPSEISGNPEVVKAYLGAPDLLQKTS